MASLLIEAVTTTKKKTNKQKTNKQTNKHTNIESSADSENSRFDYEEDTTAFIRKYNNNWILFSVRIIFSSYNGLFKLEQWHIGWKCGIEALALHRNKIFLEK